MRGVYVLSGVSKESEREVPGVSLTASLSRVVGKRFLGRPDDSVVSGKYLCLPQLEVTVLSYIVSLPLSRCLVSSP